MENNENKSNFAKMEEEVLEFWDKGETFDKSLKKEAPQGDYIFYDGPPFATGLPHHGHILAGTIKDTIPRYRTMQGYHVKRKWGWDCHGRGWGWSSAVGHAPTDKPRQWQHGQHQC